MEWFWWFGVGFVEKLKVKIFRFYVALDVRCDCCFYEVLLKNFKGMFIGIVG